jgi:hypothetical protein
VSVSPGVAPWNVSDPMEWVGACVTGSERPRTCGAKTRRGTPCANWPIRGRRRCKFNGGRSLRWFGHPNYQHGLRCDSPEAALYRGWLERERRRRRVEAIIAQGEDAVRAELARLKARRAKRS